MRRFVLQLNERGFTFNEILVAMAITGIGVLGYAVTSIVVIKGNHASNNYTIAHSLAQDKMEELRARVFLSNENRCPTAGESGINARGVPAGIFNRCWKIADSSLGASLKQLEVIVKWRDSEARSLVLSTLVYRD